MKVYAGMDIGGTKVALGVFGEDKTLLGKTKYQVGGQAVLGRQAL